GYLRPELASGWCRYEVQRNCLGRLVNLKPGYCFFKLGLNSFACLAALCVAELLTVSLTVAGRLERLEQADRLKSRGKRIIIENLFFIFYFSFAIIIFNYILL